MDIFGVAGGPGAVVRDVSVRRPRVFFVATIAVVLGRFRSVAVPARFVCQCSVMD
ncbi:hypothetical protein [Microbacterium sorbitolivorans]|uniref:hypothetical protein n=1 Tax=Microbacterium sorbitolivorans TaxID=1867410 RepID=UPI0013B0588C|nr:hypothetical protein [Microbacterium sorbitolivorans]